jgi:hypothetical protein
MSAVAEVNYSRLGDYISADRACLLLLIIFRKDLSSLQICDPLGYFYFESVKGNKRARGLDFLEWWAAKTDLYELDHHHSIVL